MIKKTHQAKDTILMKKFDAFAPRFSHLGYSNKCSFSLWSIVSFLVVSIFSLGKSRKFSLKVLIFLDILMTWYMLGTFLDWTIFVGKSYLTKPIFDFGTAVCNRLWEKTLLVASAKSFIPNGFKSKFFSGRISFLIRLLMVCLCFLSDQNLLN